MDLRRTGPPATDDERAAVDAVLGPATSAWAGGARGGADTHAAHGGHDARSRRDLLLPVLHSLQSRIGWISHGALDYVSERLTVPPADGYGVASFYALLSTTPRPPTVVHVCDDIACRVAGAEASCELLESELGAEGSVASFASATWARSPCLGQCDRAPAAFVQRADVDGRLGDVTLTEAAPAAVLAAVKGDVPEAAVVAPALLQADRAAHRLLQRVGVVDPTSLDDYRAHGGYAALRAALAMGPERVIQEVTEAKLLGRGGAAFPTGVKWQAVAARPERVHHLVCNADESEPGTFKDRVLMEHDPFALVEAMTIAGFATGCEQGYLYIRGEYPLATERMAAAVEQARARGLLGDDVLGDGVRFDIELRRGAGAYICGEETALFNSIEGYRGEPRNKPPFPVERGLFGQPTVVNNVETLLNVPRIVLEGGQAYAATGTPESTGTRLFCLSGCVERPGLVELEFGATLRDVIELAGGVRGGRPLQAVLLGGAAGSFVGPDQLDLPLTFEATRAAGVSLGSGVVMVFDDTVDLRGTLLRIARFFRDESCGQCVPCRVGTVRQEELLHRLAEGAPLGAPGQEVALLDDLARVMRDASICGLGQTAANAVQSAVVHFRAFDRASDGETVA